MRRFPIMLWRMFDILEKLFVRSAERAKRTCGSRTRRRIDTMEVYFDGSFWNSGEGRVPCKQTGVAKEFQWKGHSWQILGLYTSEEGLILDFAKQVSIEEIRSFDEKWLEKSRDKERGLADFPEENMEFENPFAEQIWMDAWIDGAEVTSISGCSCVYRPRGSRDEAREAKEAMAGTLVSQAREAAPEEAKEAAEEIPAEIAAGEELVKYYGLSPEWGWYFERKTLKKTMPWENLRIRLKPDKLQIQCKQMFETKVGEKERKITFLHPIEGSSHVLQVEEVTSEELPERFVTMGETEYRIPTHLQGLYYSFSDPADSERFTVRDLGQGDQPVCVDEKQREQGATSFFLCGNFQRAEGEDPKRADWMFQASRACFQPVDQVCWGIMAIMERGEEISLELERPKAAEEENGHGECE